MTVNPTKDRTWIKDETVRDIYALTQYFYGGTDTDSFMQMLDKIILAGIAEYETKIELASEQEFREGSTTEGRWDEKTQQIDPRVLRYHPINTLPSGRRWRMGQP